MDTILVTGHVLAGSAAVLGMLGACLTRKGSRPHRLFGRAFAVSMAVALSLAAIVSAITANVFLGSIALFTGYLIYTGWRLATVRDGRASALDRTTAFGMIATGAVMVPYGLYLVATGEGAGIALCLFGLFGSLLARQDLRHGSHWPVGAERIVRHLERMGGGSIATLTALLVVNVDLEPAFVVWLAPTLLGTPLISYFTRRVRGAASPAASPGRTVRGLGATD